MSEYDPHRSASYLLSEVRTVLSRAKTALKTWDKKYEPQWNHLLWWDEPSVPQFEPTRDDGKPGRGKFLGYSEGSHRPHPEADEMKAALEDTVAALSRWEKTGRTTTTG